MYDFFESLYGANTRIVGSQVVYMSTSLIRKRLQGLLDLKVTPFGGVWCANLK